MKINYKKLLNFNPTDKDGLIMFSLYIGILMFLLNNKIIGIIFWTMSLFLYFSSKEPIKTPCKESSIDNPYANTLWELGDNVKSCKTDDATIKNNFEHNLYRNETDLFDRRSMQGFYYQVEDVYPNDIGKLLKIYKSDKRCKSDNVNCMYPNFFNL